MVKAASISCILRQKQSKALNASLYHYFLLPTVLEEQFSSSKQKLCEVWPVYSLKYT